MTLARRIAVALWVTALFGTAPASAHSVPPTRDDVAGVAAAALHNLLDALVPAAVLGVRGAEFTAEPPQTVELPNGQDGAHLLRFPDVRLVTSGSFLSAASVDVIVLPLSSDLFEVRVQLPVVVDHLLDRAYHGALTIAEQSIRGVWSESLRMFIELEVTLGDIRTADIACDAACSARLSELDLGDIVPGSGLTAPYRRLSVTSLEWHHSLAEQEAGRWSGLVGFSGEDLVWEGDGTLNSLGQFTMEADIRSVDLSGFRDLADQMPEPVSLEPVDMLTVSRLLETTPPLLDGGSVTMRLSDLVLEDPAPTDRAPANWVAVERLGGRIAIDGLMGEATEMQISFAYSAPGLTERQYAQLVDVLPETLSMAAGVEGIPSAHAWQEMGRTVLAPLLLSRGLPEMLLFGSVIDFGATPEAYWSIGPVRADYADWAFGVDGTMVLAGPPSWSVTGGFDLILENVDRPIARLPEHPNPSLRERGLPIVRALRDIALPGTEPETLTVRIDVQEQGVVYLNGYALSGILE